MTRPRETSRPDLYSRVTNATGDQLAYAPKWSGNLSVHYERDLSGSLTGFADVNYYYRSEVNFTPVPDPATHVGGYGLVGGSVGIKGQTGSGNWKASLFVRNLFDKQVPIFLIRDPLSGVYGDAAQGGGVFQLFDQGAFRTVGVSLNVNF